MCFAYSHICLLHFNFRWSQTVTRSTDKYELYLKVLLTPTDPIGPFVQSYLLLLTDFSQLNFGRFLEIKGISRKSEQEAFFDEFHRHVPPTPAELSTIEPSLTNDSSNVLIVSTAGMINNAASSLFSRFKSSLNVVDAIKRSYTRQMKNSE